MAAAAFWHLETGHPCKKKGKYGYSNEKAASQKS